MDAVWTCPKCGRGFARKSQRHACGTGDRERVLRGRPPALIALYTGIEAYAKSLGPIEIVTRERYVLFRSTRIFADLVMMTDAVHIAIHVGRELDDPAFFKVVSDGRKVTHVAKLTTGAQGKAMQLYLKEAYAFSLKPSTKA